VLEKPEVCGAAGNTLVTYGSGRKSAITLGESVTSDHLPVKGRQGKRDAETKGFLTY
jgi:hypothetical protein